MQKASRGERLLRPFVGVVIALYFFRLTRASLHIFFTPDDAMNLYRSWSLPLVQLIKANLLFFQTSPFYRPLGSAWYRAIFHFAGFHPVPFHAADLIILAANIYLTYAVARRLSGSYEAGALAALLGCYHTAFRSLYFDTGFIYDVICYFFYFSTFLIYLTIRQKGRFLDAWAVTACSALYICALNSKEMAVTLPFFLAAYEWLYHPARGRSLSELRRWLFAEGRGPLAIGAITLIFIAGRVSGPEALLQNADYRPVLSWHRFMETSQGFLNPLFFQENWFTPATVILLWAALLGIAWVTKSRPLRFAWIFLMLSVAPIAFVSPRGASQYYIPFFGWVLYAAVALVEGTKYLVERISYSAPAWVTRLRGPCLFATLLVMLYPNYKAKGLQNIYSVTNEAPLLQAVASQLQGLHAQVPKRARMFFLNDPHESAWDLLYIVRLTYHDTAIVVDRRKTTKRMLGPRELASYDYVFDYEGSRFVEKTCAPGLRPAVATKASMPEFYHGDWSAVTASHPAHPGEAVIAKAKDLGITSPEVGQDEPFPTDPSARVISRIEVTVDGRGSDVLNELGWPGLANTYRVDFRLPAKTTPGEATVVITARNAAADPVKIPVQ